MCLFAFNTPSLVKRLFRSFAHRLLVGCFLTTSLKNSFCVLNITPLPEPGFGIIFLSYCVTQRSETLDFDEVQFFNSFSFLSHTLGAMSVKFLPEPGS